MGNLSRIAGTVLGTTTLAALPAAVDAGVVNETPESLALNNDTFPGQSVTLGVADSLAGDTNGRARTIADPFGDPIDFFTFSGLAAGGAFDFQVLRSTPCFLPQNLCATVLQAGIYTSQNGIGSSITIPKTGAGNAQDLTGIVPGSGQLTLGIKDLSSDSFEGYQVRLSVSSPSRVPQPATIALLLAGLAGMQVLRRRKRR
jgi:hypothetical protein